MFSTSVAIFLRAIRQSVVFRHSPRMYQQEAFDEVTTSRFISSRVFRRFIKFVSCKLYLGVIFPLSAATPSTGLLKRHSGKDAYDLSVSWRTGSAVIPACFTARHDVCRSRCVTPRFRLILNGSLTQSREDGIIGVVKINIHIPWARSVASVPSSPGFFFSLCIFYPVLLSLCAEVGSRIKANGNRPASRSTKRRNVYFVRVYRLPYTLLPWGNDFSRACPSVRSTHSSVLSFLENGAAAVRRETGLNPPSILRYFRPFARFIPHTELRDADDRCM